MLGLTSWLRLTLTSSAGCANSRPSLPRNGHCGVHKHDFALYLEKARGVSKCFFPVSVSYGF